MGRCDRLVPEQYLGVGDWFQSTQQFVTATMPICKSLVARRYDLVLREGDIKMRIVEPALHPPQCQRTCLTSTYGLRELTPNGVFNWALANALYLLDNFHCSWCITNRNAVVAK